MDWTVWTVDVDGNFTYLGRQGKGFGFAPILWEDTEGGLVGFIAAPQGRQNIFQSFDGMTLEKIQPAGTADLAKLANDAGPRASEFSQIALCQQGWSICSKRKAA